jgi:hypothetical protein
VDERSIVDRRVRAPGERYRNDHPDQEPAGSHVPTVRQGRLRSSAT